MLKVGCDVAVRYGYLVAVLIGFGLPPCGATAQDDPRGQASASAILEDFEKTWDDKNWRPRYMRPLDDVGWRHRMTALQRLARQGKQGAADLAKALESDSAPVRALAAQALGYCGDSDMRAALGKAAEKDASPVVRLYAADSLGMLGGREFDKLLRRLQPNEKNGDAKRHLQYALDREGRPIDAKDLKRLSDWRTNELATAEVGKLAPDFELTSIDGKSIRLSDFRGKKSVVLVFVYGDT